MSITVTFLRSPSLKDLDEAFPNAGVSKLAERCAGLEAENAQLREAMREDVELARSGCGQEGGHSVSNERCAHYKAIGKKCHDCPMDCVASTREALGEKTRV